MLLRIKAIAIICSAAFRSIADTIDARVYDRQVRRDQKEEECRRQYRELLRSGSKRSNGEA